MNSNYGKPKGSASGPLNNFDFGLDLGLGSARPKPLNDQKSRTTSSYSSPTAPKSSWQQPNKPSWTHQPSAPSQSNRPVAGVGLGLNGPTSMVGDISGKSWSSSSPAKSTSGIGIVDKNPNLFGDLVSSALGQGTNKSNSNVPLKNATPTTHKSSYSMGNMADSLPKTSNSAKSSGNWGSGGGSFGSSSNVNVNFNVNTNKSSSLGGPSMKSTSAGANKDPFVSLVDFGSKQSGGSLNSGSKGNKGGSSDDAFGDFQNAPKPGANAFPSSGFASSNNDFMQSSKGPDLKMDDFGIPTKSYSSQNQPSNQSQSTGGDPLDMFFSPSSASAGGAAAATASGGGQQFSELDDWGDSEFVGGNDTAGSTTELEGLPPPPAGVSGGAAKNKGIDSKNSGQYADAIKWLSWAVILLEKSGDKVATIEVLSSRASCYKEVGEYKKAVADCSKALEQDDANVSILVQRALLYESMEKYKLGAEDLRSVLKIDPGNRIARSTVHRLTKMID